MISEQLRVDAGEKGRPPVDLVPQDDLRAKREGFTVATSVLLHQVCAPRKNVGVRVAVRNYVPTESPGDQVHPAIALFRKWDSEADSQTEQEWDELKLRLDANRQSQRKLFRNEDDSAR